MAQFSTNEAVSLEKQIDTSVTPVQTRNLEELRHNYEIERCAKWIQENNFEKVCLQFPDYLLPDSSSVALELQEILGKTVYILGDTAYESCCVDYVAAAHINGDAIIHFGPICFSKTTEEKPCLFIHEKHKISIEKLGENLRNVERGQEIGCIVVDSPFLHALDNIKEITGQNTQVLEVSQIISCKNSANVLFIGCNDRKLLNIKLSLQNNINLYYYDPLKNTKIQLFTDDNKIYKRRNFLIEKIKDCSTAGIVIGTLAVKNYLGIIQRLKNLLKLSGKKYYILSVGKPTVAKLANFPEIELYIVISCAMNEIYDSRDFYKPIVTAYDVEVALNPDSKNVKFSYDYSTFLENCQPLNENTIKNAQNSPDISLISGKIRTAQDIDEKMDISEDSTIAVKDSGELALNNSFGAGFLAQKSWKGLEQNLGQTEVKMAEEGRSGIAQSYNNET